MTAMIFCCAVFVGCVIVTVRGSEGQYCFRLSFFLCYHDNS